jgi:2-C-methyl-D-erythritol 4-phosphate cytidylyltransferase/2-C-methyl-D-erythritol 2,4-cyclodiphosphate synthase
MIGVATILVAAGRGTRTGSPIPKQYRTLDGRPVMRMALDIFSSHPLVDVILPVIHADDRERFARASDGLSVLTPVIGGATRQVSVRHGLEALVDQQPDVVLVHDAARPFATAALITRAVKAAQQFGAAIPTLPVTDTVKDVDRDGRVQATRARDSLRLVQTPQAFRFADLLAAHRKAAEAGRDDFSDDSALAEWAGLAVHTFDGEPANIKLTSNEDFARADLMHQIAHSDVRTGSGIDVHAFGAGNQVTLGGVGIPHDHGLVGHSDADVVLHALVDAMLGALADGDIGVHFPPSDPQWRGAASDRFVAFAVERMRARRGIIAHADINVVCEAPRIGPYRDAMRVRIATLLGIDVSRVAVKATTSEGLGFIGRGEGIAALATVTVRLPWAVS